MQEFAVQIGMHLQAVNVGVHRAQMMHRWSASNCIVFILLPFTPVSLIRAHSSRCEGSGPLLLETRAARGTGRGLEFRALAQEIAAAVLYGFWFALNGIRCPHGNGRYTAGLWSPTQPTHPRPLPPQTQLPYHVLQPSKPAWVFAPAQSPCFSPHRCSMLNVMLERR